MTKFFSSVCISVGFSALVLVTTVGYAQQNPQTRASGSTYRNGSLAFRYSIPHGMLDKTARFTLQIEDQPGSWKTLGTLLALSSGSDSSAPRWGSVTIVTYPRNDVPEPDDSKAEAQMNAWVAHSRDASALPRPAVISGQKFTVSVFGLREGTVTKGAVVWTTVRKGKLLSFAFAANSPEVLKNLTESMKIVQFY
ncbi:MAG TPA: hypothetical protein VJO35_15440 [Terriglobales bacterium]|nr:hypothetical protein [Terriglobales bacterium]